MRKLILGLFLGACGMLAQAQTTRIYTDDLVVTINGESTEPQETQIFITDNGDGTYNMELKNFCLGAGEEVMYVGNIQLENIPGEQADGYTTINTVQTINIQPGDLEGEIFWLGPMLGNVPIDFKSKLTADKMYCTIDIDMMESLEQIIYVTFGTDDFQGSSVESIKTDNANAPVCVYTLQGAVVKTNVSPASALDGLRKGVYIVGGKKVIKK